VSRTLNDDFEDDAPAGALDLETGSHAGVGAGAGGAGNYGGGGLEFDDDLEDAPAGPLELDVPVAPRSAAPQVVPDLPVPPPAPSSGRGLGGHSAPPARPSGSHAAAPAPPSSDPRLGGAHPAPPGSNPSMPAAPGSNPSMPAAPGSNPGMVPAAHGGAAPHAAAAPPAPPSAAALVAKYPPVPLKIWEAPVYFIRVVLRQVELRQDLTALRRRRSPDVPLYEAALRAHDKKTFALGMAITLAGLTIALFLFFLPVFRRFLWND